MTLMADAPARLASAGDSYPSLIPELISVVRCDGWFVLSGGMSIAAAGPAAAEARILALDISAATGLHLPVHPNRDPSAAAAGHVELLVDTTDADLGPEEY